MSLLAWYVVLGAVQVALALWVILAQPRRLLNWAVGTLLILWAGSGIMFQMWREATTFESAFLSVSVGYVYHTPSYFLILLVIDRLLLPSPKPHGWRGLLLASGVAMPIFWIFRDDGQNWYTTVPSLVNAAAGDVILTAAVLLAARAANDRGRSTLQRRQAALVGLAFALLVAHLGASQLGNLFWGPPYVADGAITFGTVVKGVFTTLGTAGLLAALYGFVRLPAPFHAGARAAMRAALLLTILVGVVSYATVAGFTIVGGRAIVLSAFSLVIAVAVLRYDLAAAGTKARPRVQAISAWVLGLCIVSILAVAAWSLLPQGGVVLGIALAAVVVPAALLMTPLKRLPAWLTRHVLLHPRDSEALRERVRVYASTLRAATGPDGRLVPGTEAALETLRTQLGLSQRDHDLLLSMGGGENASGIVAYRLALVGAGADGEKLRPGELERLREELNVTEREHAFVAEHLGASADSLAAGALFLGRYHVLRRLGEGGFGEVWLAHDTREGLDVVLKHLAAHDRRDAAAFQRLRREVDASAFQHENIVKVLGVETVGDEMYLVMEHMRGGSLADVLRARGRLPEPDVARIAADVLAALAALHARGFVHRDVKPANILFDEHGLAKLGDFNIARELVSGDTLGGGGPRGPVGTFGYMPPEQARGLAARPQSDLYGLAATLYEAVSGAPLMDLVDLSHTEAVARIGQHVPPTSTPHASPALSAALARALASSPEDRFASAVQMREAILSAGTPEGFAPRSQNHLA